jgi:hypothetical protein
VGGPEQDANRIPLDAISWSARDQFSEVRCGAIFQHQGVAQRVAPQQGNDDDQASEQFVRVSQWLIPSSAL